MANEIENVIGQMYSGAYDTVKKIYDCTMGICATVVGQTPPPATTGIKFNVDEATISRRTPIIASTEKVIRDGTLFN